MKKIIVLFLFVFLLSGCFFNDSPKGPIEVKIGEEIICENGKYSVTVDKFSFKTGSISKYQSVPKGKEWVGVTISVKNTGNEVFTFYETDFNLINSNGVIIDPSINTYDIWGVQRIGNVELAPGGSKTGYISFANENTDNSNLILEYICEGNILTYTDDVTYHIPLK